MLVCLGVEIKCSRVSHVASSLIGNDCYIIAYFVLLRIAFERVKRSAHSNIRRPCRTSIGAKGIEQLRVSVVGGISCVIPDSIQAAVGRYRKCSKPVPLVRINRVVIDFDRGTKGGSVVCAAGEHHVGCASPGRYHAGQHVNVVVSRTARLINGQE